MGPPPTRFKLMIANNVHRYFFYDISYAAGETARVPEHPIPCPRRGNRRGQGRVCGGQSPRESGLPIRCGATNTDGRGQVSGGQLRGCVSTQSPVPGGETAEVGGCVRGPIEPK